MAYTIKEIESVDGLMQLKGKWNALLERSETNTVFLTFEWIFSWWKCFGEGKKLFILVVMDGEKLIAIAPLMITSSKFGITIRKIEFIGTPLSNYNDFIISEECENKRTVLWDIYVYLLKKKDSWDVISLGEIPETSSTLNISEEILKNLDIFSAVFPDDICPTLVFEESQKEEIEKKLNKRRIRRKFRSLSRIGNLEHCHCRSTDEAMLLLDIFFQYHINRWKSTNTPSVFKDERYRVFYRELVESLLVKNWVIISFLRFNEKPIAFEFGFTYNNKYDGYTLTYDVSYAKHSPGMILGWFDTKEHLSKNFKEIDFGRGDEAYKYRFANKTRKNYKLRVHRTYPLFLLDEVINRLMIEIMKYPRLRYSLRGFRDRIINTGLFRK